MKYNWKDNAVMGSWVESGGRGMHGLAKVFIFSFSGCDVFESEKVGWIGWWDGAVSWEEMNMFHGC